jgi:PAS domain S-box-containing protein
MPDHLALPQLSDVYRLVGEAVPDFIWSARLTGEPGQYVWALDHVNQRWQDYTGLTLEQANAAGWQSLHHPDELPRFMTRVAQATVRCEVFEVEFRYRRHDGEYRWFLGRQVPIRDATGRVVQWVGTLTDIHAPKHLEEALRSSEGRFRNLVEELEKLMDVVPLGVFIAHDPECRRITGNRAGYEMMRLPAGSNLSVTPPPGELPPFVARRNGQVLPPEQLPIQYAAAHGVEVRDVEVEFLYPDGATLTLFGSASPLFDDRGGIRGCVAAFLDITARKKAEEALKEADRRKDEFLAMLAHELRNPLAPIRNAAHILRLVGGTDANLTRARDMIERQVQHLSRLVDDLLDVSRITRGKITLQMARLDLAGAVARAVETSRPVIDARRHQLTVTLPAAPLWVVGDATRLAQVLANLLTNAAKYTPDGGRIELLIEAKPGEAVLRVRDNGVGIAAELLPQVFDLFTQGDRSLARSEGGLGIGLTMVKSLTEMHRGCVAAFSEGPGRGSEFVVRLPTVAAGPTDAAEKRPGREAAPRRRVLVVDDNLDAAESLAMLLRLEKHTVHTAHDGPAALLEAEAFRPEVVLLDIGLPRMDGYEVARRLREELGLKAALLVAVTGYGQEEDRRRSEEAGFDAHLTKPADLATVQRLLNAAR